MTTILGHCHFVPLSRGQILVGETSGARGRGWEGQAGRRCEVCWIYLDFRGRLTERSCRKRGDGWFVAMNKWQDLTDMEVSKGLLYGHLYSTNLMVNQPPWTCSRSFAGKFIQRVFRPSVFKPYYDPVSS
jgi:hypothetical protein